MAKMEPYVKTWYDHLNDGKLMGVKCQRCGSYEFPPLPVCNSCSGTDVRWVEMSGEAELTTFSFSPIGIPPYHAEPVMSGWFKLDEGVVFMSYLLDVGVDTQEELLGLLPVPVQAEVKQIDENVSWPVFRIKR